MNTLFVGGPWHGQLKYTTGEMEIEAPVRVTLTLKRNQFSTTIPPTVWYRRNYFVFQGRTYAVFTCHDKRSEDEVARLIETTQGVKPHEPR